MPATTNGKSAASTAIALPTGGLNRAEYLDSVASTGIVGRMIKFSKEGKFITPDTEEEIGEETDFIVLADQTWVGLVKFTEGAPPERVGGLLYDEGFKTPDRASLGDTDSSEWPLGLDNRPQDPWQHQQYLVLQHGDTAELFTFVTGSITGRRAVGNLLRHYDRMQRTNPNDLPVVKLKKSGFQHRDERIGWVATPVFVVCGRSPKDSAAKPDTSLETQMNDRIPF